MVCMTVCVLVTCRLKFAKLTEVIDMPFAGSHGHKKPLWGAYGRNLANTIERSVLGSAAGLSLPVL